MADEFLSTMDMVKHYKLNIEDYETFYNSMTEREREALINYAGNDYEEINRSLRLGQPTDDAVTLMNLFKRAPKVNRQLEVFRAVTYSDEYPEPPDGDYVFRGIVSTTFDSEMSNAPLDEDSTVLLITVNPGVRAILWNEMGEMELMLPDGIVGGIDTFDDMDDYSRAYDELTTYNTKHVWIEA